MRMAIRNKFVEFDRLPGGSYILKFFDVPRNQWISHRDIDAMERAQEVKDVLLKALAETNSFIALLEKRHEN